MLNADPAELAKFGALAHRWWDPGSDFKPLHDINPLRLDYIERRSGGLAGKQTLDVGCGGGILAEAMARAGATVTGIELLGLVPDPASTVAACAKLVKVGGLAVFSTINRNPKAYLFAVIGGEYILRLLPRGTHDYARLIKPSELAAFGRGAGLEPDDLVGMTYNPLARTYRLEADTSVNYIATFRRDA